MRKGDLASFCKICKNGAPAIDQLIARQGLTENLAQAFQAEVTDLLLRLLDDRCGPLQPDQRAAISALPLERRQQMLAALQDFQPTHGLGQWLGEA